MKADAEPLKDIGSVARMVNYIKKQSIKADEVLTVWEDYLRMAGASGLDITDDIVRFPKNLRQRHDQLVELKEEQNDQKRMKEYAPLDNGFRTRQDITGRMKTI